MRWLARCWDGLAKTLCGCWLDLGYSRLVPLSPVVACGRDPPRFPRPFPVVDVSGPLTGRAGGWRADQGGPQQPASRYRPGPAGRGRYMAQGPGRHTGPACSDRPSNRPARSLLSHQLTTAAPPKSRAIASPSPSSLPPPPQPFTPSTSPHFSFPWRPSCEARQQSPILRAFLFFLFVSLLPVPLCPRPHLSPIQAPLCRGVRPAVPPPHTPPNPHSPDEGRKKRQETPATTPQAPDA